MVHWCHCAQGPQMGIVHIHAVLHMLCVSVRDSSVHNDVAACQAIKASEAHCMGRHEYTAVRAAPSRSSV